MGWYGFDLDGSLAYHAEHEPVDYVGEPIPRTLALVKWYLANDQEVRIVTARAAPEWDDRDRQIAMIEKWCLKHVGQILPVQSHKNGGMLRLYDDRAIGLQRNTGIPLHELHLIIDRATAAQRIERVFYDRTGITMDSRVAEAIAAEILKNAYSED